MSAYLRIFDPIDVVSPFKKMIKSDTYNVITSVKYIVEAKGCTIPYVNNLKNLRKGWQREVWGSKDTNHGGKRVRMLAEDDYGKNSKKKCTNMHSLKFISSLIILLRELRRWLSISRITGVHLTLIASPSDLIQENK